ncbi:MAG: Ig-like domain-containing protein, partial [Eubacteriales bacterium]
MKKVLSVLFALGLALQFGLFTAGSAQFGINAYAVSKVSVASIKLSPVSLKLKVGSTFKIKATIAPSTATNKSVSWQSSNSAVVKIDSTGKVTALHTGSAIITCTAKDGSGKKTVCKATISATTKPTTIADIVSYYNLASNKAKKDKPGFTLVTTNIIGKITSSSGFIQSVAGTVVGMFNTKPTISTVAKGSNGDLPVQGQSYGSKLLPGSLKSATCVDKGSVYEITLNFKDEKLSALPTDPTKTNHGQALNVLSASDISVQTDKFKAIVKVQQFAPTYTGSYIR